MKKKKSNIMHSHAHKDHVKKAKRKNIHKAGLGAIGILLIILFIYVAILIPDTEEVEKEVPIQIVEENDGSGFLTVETVPKGALVYNDGEYSGKTPITIYNVKKGKHKIIIQKEGYKDYQSTVTIESGRKTFLEANLDLIPIEKDKTVENIDEEININQEIIEIKDEIEQKKPIFEGDFNINIGDKHILFYDFSEKIFENRREFSSDVFSKRFKNHLVFTRFDPVTIKTIDKSLKDVTKQDCDGLLGTYELLNSGQSMCINTKEGGLIVIGGEWSDTENTILSYKQMD